MGKHFISKIGKWRTITGPVRNIKYSDCDWEASLLTFLEDILHAAITERDPELQIFCPCQNKLRKEFENRRGGRTLCLMTTVMCKFFLAVNFNFAKCEVLTLGVRRKQKDVIER